MTINRLAALLCIGYCGAAPTRWIATTCISGVIAQGGVQEKSVKFVESNLRGSMSTPDDNLHGPMRVSGEYSAGDEYDGEYDTVFAAQAVSALRQYKLEDCERSFLGDPFVCVIHPEATSANQDAWAKLMLTQLQRDESHNAPWLLKEIRYKLCTDPIREIMIPGSLIAMNGHTKPPMHTVEQEPIYRCIANDMWQDRITNPIVTPGYIFITTESAKLEIVKDTNVLTRVIEVFCKKEAESTAYFETNVKSAQSAQSQEILHKFLADTGQMMREYQVLTELFHENIECTCTLTDCSSDKIEVYIYGEDREPYHTYIADFAHYLAKGRTEHYLNSDLKLDNISHADHLLIGTNQAWMQAFIVSQLQQAFAGSSYADHKRLEIENFVAAIKRSWDSYQKWHQSVNTHTQEDIETLRGYMSQLYFLVSYAPQIADKDFVTPPALAVPDYNFNQKINALFAR